MSSSSKREVGTGTTSWAIALLISLSGMGGIYPAQAQPETGPTKSLKQQAEDVAALLEGQMVTSAQSMETPEAPRVRMTTCRIQVTNASVDPGSIFLYQEQALTNNLSKPYRQRFLQISPSPATESVRSLSFRPTTAATFAGLCNKSLAERTLRLSDLGTYVCSVFLKPSGNTYIGNTPINGCPANYRGAVRITNQIELTPTGMNTWDRGFDANGQQVWGAKTEAYQYHRLEKPKQ
ncbi:chromophore lyase CpcT/CpeT [Leptodesmis sichuanensis]|uniref:chromophore lyase CpcT/CpeT n=1 Tax=Leptodesmis sichuanensis TaxID=2906798 RepID=UPI001F3A269E|nr:chromophore lyase CpcT/CpeT [Leptodesmis sichuanensis]UIE37222.1 chromophore lyase CpcT/CpeT [Leptodesmis sichuanensis A121]